MSGRIWVPVPIKEDPITVYISAPRLQDPQLHTFFFIRLPTVLGNTTHTSNTSSARRMSVKVPVFKFPPSGAACPHLSELLNP